MCRQKSPECIQLERDRAIRAERRAQRKAEREARRALRLKKRMTHESVVANGTPKVQPDDSRFGLREAIAYSWLMDCQLCHIIKRKNEFQDGLCDQCHFNKEANDLETLKPKGDNPKGGFPYSPPMGQQGNLYEGGKDV
jgi:hypothetical protein